MKQTALADITQALVMPYLDKDFYPTKHDKRPKPPVTYHYEVKYVLKREGEKQVAKGVPYVRPEPKQMSRRDKRRAFGRV